MKRPALSARLASLLVQASTACCLLRRLFVIKNPCCGPVHSRTIACTVCAQLEPAAAADGDEWGDTPLARSCVACGRPVSGIQLSTVAFCRLTAEAAVAIDETVILLTLSLHHY